MKKFLMLMLSVVMVLSLSACGQEAPKLLMDDGDWINCSEDAIVSDSFYIYKDNEKYYSFLSVPVGDDATGSKYIWFTEPYDAAIPHMTVRDKLLFYSEKTRPGSLTLYKLTDYGYTLGAMFNVNNNTGDPKYPQVINFTDTFNPFSPAASVVAGAKTSSATIYITEINNHDFTANLLVNDSFLKGLTKDTMYAIGFYAGTVHKSVNLKADTHLFIQEATYTASSYQELKSKTFEIYLPSNLAPGYYYAEGVGMFYYEGTIADIDEDDIEDMLEEENNESTESSDEGETYIPQQSTTSNDNEDSEQSSEEQSSEEQSSDEYEEPLGDELVDDSSSDIDGDLMDSSDETPIDDSSDNSSIEE